MQVRMTAKTGAGDRLADLLLQAAAALRDDTRCLLYVVSRVTGEPDVILITEAWTDREAHDASLSHRCGAGADRPGDAADRGLGGGRDRARRQALRAD